MISFRLGSNVEITESLKMVRKEGGRELGEKSEEERDGGRWRVPGNWSNDVQENGPVSGATDK